MFVLTCKVFYFIRDKKKNDQREGTLRNMKKIETIDGHTDFERSCSIVVSEAGLNIKSQKFLHTARFTRI